METAALAKGPWLVILPQMRYDHWNNGDILQSLSSADIIPVFLDEQSLASEKGNQHQLLFI